MKSIFYLLLALSLVSCTSTGQEVQGEEKLQALIIDGSNNHYIWPKTTFMMKDYLEETGLFEVAIHRLDSVWLGIKYNQSRPVPYEGYIADYPVGEGPPAISKEPLQAADVPLDFSQYDVVISNLGASTPRWPAATEQKFEEYVKNGGGFVVVHAANNAWGDWEAFNKMIGLGAWGDRDSTTGPYVYYDDQGAIQEDPSAGVCATHGLEHEYRVSTRAGDHPIMQGLPSEWLHAKDELYDRMRGPFEGATVLATAYSDPEDNKQPWPPVLAGTGRHVPVLMAINYGEGRVFHSTMGHFDYSMECLGFQVTFQRGVEWAASGEVSQEIPQEFPSADASLSKAWMKKN
jgi:type 1 glutamine amidotransferase